MPWKGTTAMDHKIKFVRAFDRYVRSGEKTMSELCEEHDIARKTGYKLIHRRDEGGWVGLADRSRSPKTGSLWCDSDLVARALEVRLEFP